MINCRSIRFSSFTTPIVILTLIFSLFCIVLVISPIYISVYGHFSHAAHYNNGQIGIGNEISVFQQMEPEYPKPNETAYIQFSIQDKQGRDTTNKVVLVEIYSTLTNERIAVFPWTIVEIGDFQVPFIFPKIGNYQIVLSLLNADANPDEILNTVPPPRNILVDSLNCNCERAVFNISVGESFGSIFLAVIYGSILGVVFIVGGVLSWMYLSRRKSKTNPISNEEFIKYSVLFLAVGASIVHIAVYSGHATLRLEYSIFLISAAGGQLFYGISYIFLIFSDDRLPIKKTDKRFITKEYYKKSKILNLIGLAGSLVLIGLYIYSVTFPPPLSPNAHPEDVDFAGILDKSLEILLVIGITYLMKVERKRYLYSRQISDNKNI